MIKASILIFSSLIFLCGFTVWAEEGPSLFDRLARDGPKRGGFAQIEELVKNGQAVQNEIAIKMASEKNSAEDIQNITYDERGWISSVVYADGSVVNQGYRIDDNGKIGACIVESDDVIITIKKGNTRNDKGGISVEIILKNQYDKTGPGDTTERDREHSNLYDPNLRIGDINEDGKIDATDREAPDNEDVARIGDPKDPDPDHARPMIVYHLKKKIGLEELATKPIRFNFKEIHKTLAKASALKASALKEYENNTKGYYDKLEDIVVNKGLLVERDYYDHAPEASRRAAVDKAVEEAYAAVARGERGDPLEEILYLDKLLRREILDPAGAIYESKLRSVKDQVNEMIEKLIETKIAVYLNLNVKDDRIDTVINLREDSP